MGGMMVQKERRRLPRYHAPEGFTAIAEFPPHRRYRLHVKDIGLDGFRFVTDADVSRENVFSLSFEVAGKEQKAIRIGALATIRWFIHDEETHSYTAGAHFLKLEDSDQELLQAFLETLNLKNGR
jgi:hypothetical protein